MFPRDDWSEGGATLGCTPMTPPSPYSAKARPASCQFEKSVGEVAAVLRLNSRSNNASSMKMSFPNDHGPWEATNDYKGADVPNYHNDIPPYALWDPHHCLAGQNPGLGGYPDIITAFNSELVWQRQQCASRLSRNDSPGHQVQSQKKPRRRVATIAQRRAANIRERRRMFNLNEAFDKLRRKVPTFAYEKRLSRIETLRLAITYISFMTELLHGTSPDLKSNDVYQQREYIPYGLIN